MKAQIYHLRTELRTIVKGSNTVSEFLLKIKSIVNSLISIGDSVTTDEHIQAILGGLPNDFESIITYVYSRDEPLPVHKIESLILAHKSRLEKKLTNPNPLTINLAKTSVIYESDSTASQENLEAAVAQNAAIAHNTACNQFQNQKTTQQVTIPLQVLDHLIHYTRTDHNHGYTHRGGRFRGRGGRSRGRSSLHCQLCNKSGHTVMTCWHRFDHNFHPTQYNNYIPQSPYAPSIPSSSGMSPQYNNQSRHVNVNVAFASKNISQDLAWYRDSEHPIMLLHTVKTCCR